MKFGDKKIKEKDVGFAEDSFELLKHAVGDESHCLANYIIFGGKDNLEKLKDARIRRSNLMDSVCKVLGVDLKGQDWCRMKHICGEAIGCQELIVRLIEDKFYEQIKIVSHEHKGLYLEYLKILGFTEKNAKPLSSA